jgi:hypothetical protein
MVYEHLIKELIIDKEFSLAQALLREQSTLLSCETLNMKEG